MNLFCNIRNAPNIKREANRKTVVDLKGNVKKSKEKKNWCHFEMQLLASS